MVSQYGATCTSPISHGSSTGTSDDTSDGVPLSPDRSPAVKWSIEDTPLASYGVPAKVNCIADLQDQHRRLPQAPMHEPPRGPIRAVSASLPKEDSSKGG